MCIPKFYINKFEFNVPDSDNEEYHFYCMEWVDKDQDSDN